MAAPVPVTPAKALPVGRKGRKPRRYSPEEKALVLDLVADTSPAKAAEDSGVPISTISGWMDRHGRTAHVLSGPGGPPQRPQAIEFTVRLRVLVELTPYVDERYLPAPQGAAGRAPTEASHE